MKTKIVLNYSARCGTTYSLTHTHRPVQKNMQKCLAIFSLSSQTLYTRWLDRDQIQCDGRWIGRIVFVEFKRVRCTSRRCPSSPFATTCLARMHIHIYPRKLISLRLAQKFEKKKRMSNSYTFGTIKHKQQRAMKSQKWGMRNLLIEWSRRATEYTGCTSEFDECWCSAFSRS